MWLFNLLPFSSHTNPGRRCYDHCYFVEEKCEYSRAESLASESMLRIVCWRGLVPAFVLCLCFLLNHRGWNPENRISRSSAQPRTTTGDRRHRQQWESLCFRKWQEAVICCNSANNLWKWKTGVKEEQLGASGWDLRAVSGNRHLSVLR